MNRDFVEMLLELSAAGAEFLVVGAHALAAHGVPRATGDIDIWVRPTDANADRVLQALAAFGAPLFDLSKADLTKTDTVFQMGVPPGRIDIMTGISGVAFDDAWERRVNLLLPGMPVPIAVISKMDFVTNKQAAGRTKDLLDVQMLAELDQE